jgi:hypothetical protein
MNICSKCKYKKGWKWIKEQKRFAEYYCGIWHSGKEECDYFKPKWYLRLFYKKIKK